MALHFFDSSGLTKGYTNETGSAWVRGLLLPTAGNETMISALSQVEVIAALRRRERTGDIAPYEATLAISFFRYQLENNFSILPVNSETIERAMQLADQHVLKGYDAVQLATALLLNEDRLRLGLPPLIFVSADEGLNAVTAGEGLAVEDPNQH